ncbi:L-rhamnose-binding lectin CSL2-like [Stegastes partitus]|uniref:L-rhamnose-binding lectin CSL2-like n=1 Tax=Stegastes partitus TaxID=144197 RepID=A0A3B4ZKD1_9TELE|nr:PREDICTED: L-rhamnose-binding lectin CSL2-like [Stegastes partitus]
MLSFTLSAVLLLAAACLLTTSVGSIEKAVTCDFIGNVQHLGCDKGVIRVEAALYGRADRNTCSAGTRPFQVANTRCSQGGTVDVVRRRCNGKKVCELNTNVVRSPDPCRGTIKYLETNYTCVPAFRAIACEGSFRRLFCGEGQVISVFGAFYGRHDQTTCSFGRPPRQLLNVDCLSLNSNTTVTNLCNGKNNCTVSASNSVFGDPCGGTYKYLEVAYVCEFPLESP